MRLGNGAIVAALSVAFLVISVGVGASFYYDNVYNVDRANAWVDLAAADNNLTQVLADLNESLALLAPYHGNPNPLFPQPRTNFDLIKQQIEATVASGEVVVHESPDNFSYQQALKNIQSDLTTTLYGEINDTATAMLWWGFLMWDFLSLVLLAVGSFFLFILRE